MNSRIQFFSEGFSFILKDKNAIRSWLINTMVGEKKKPWYINFIFCSDEYLSELNKTYLKHDGLTDILTFPFAEEPETISGDIYISVDRVKENAENFGEQMEQELRRVMIHGILHLMGYKDKTEDEKKRMRKKENHYLKKFKDSVVGKWRSSEIKGKIS